MSTPVPLWMKQRGIEPQSAAVAPPPATPQPLGNGPGTILLEMNKRDYGVPHCKDCADTARRMNEGGPGWCLSHIEELIDEIQPRVQKWLEAGEVGGVKVAEPTWTMRMAAKFPDASKRWKIRGRILQACETYEQQRLEALPSEVAELWPDPTEDEWPALQRLAEVWDA